MKNFNIPNLKDLFKYLFLFIFIALTIFYILVLYVFIKNNYFNFLSDSGNIISNVLPNANPSNDPSTLPERDPVRYWPSGVPQSLGVIGAGLSTFYAITKIAPQINPRFRLLGALGALGVSSTVMTYHSAIENPVGFNRFMYASTTYARTGIWPNLSNVSENNMQDFIKRAIEEAHKDPNLVKTIDAAVKEAIEKSKSKYFDDFNLSDLINNILDKIYYYISSSFKPIPIEGFLDDLIGQQIIIHMILFILLISILLLYLYFIINIIFLLNKDWIIKKFNNKFITFYIKYQSFFARLALIYLPILILIGMLVLAHGLYFLITHQIPYHKLDLDLHTYIPK